LFVVKNEIKVTEDDIAIRNEKGNRAYFIKAPGNYSLHFKRIVVTKDFGIRFDLPYTMIPETGLLDQKCDEYSGIVQRAGRHRYCDICGLTEKLENGLNEEGHLFLPEIARGNEKKFAPVCNRISSDTYEFKRTINLPGRRELEARVSEKVQGLDGEIRQRLNKRRGRFQVFLNLISAKQPPIKQDAWFAASADCRCCSRERDASCRGVLSFLYCNSEDCKSTWAQQCLHNSARIAACYTVEFNYRMTTSYTVVTQFLRDNNYPDQERFAAPPTTASPHQPAIDEDDHGSLPLAERCVTRMPERLSNLRRYCTIFWNDKLCCSHCPGTC
uniref:VWFD domain-containing protein n=1 Tax=Gongylonema pulchrum TaxID=637853 RepID=A0A183CU82_9BILA